MVEIAPFTTLESEVRSYCRDFPAVFGKARGSCLFDVDGQRYVDFFCGAGALNYGHAHPLIKRHVLAYLEQDGIIHSLDLATGAKKTFLERFQQVILQPRGLDYKIQFPGPTGTNAVEACLKLARKVSGRHKIAYFKGAFHGMTLGALSVSGDAQRRESAGIPLDFTLELPFETDAGGRDLPADLEEQWGRCSEDDVPSALILETTQAEGGVRTASTSWLRALREVTQRFGVLLIVDDIQVGCGRAGDFFSFEEAQIQPDLICLSKSISGYGLPLSLVLLKPELDVWRPGEHNGTFRGQNLSFVAGAAALSFWETESFKSEIASKAEVLRDTLLGWKSEFDGVTDALGRGMIQGLAFADPTWAGQISRAAFERGLVIECAGSGGQVLKFLPALTIPEDELHEGLKIVAEALQELSCSEPIPVAVGAD